MDDGAIRELLTRLARPQPGGAATVERAALAAEGADLEAVTAWIEAHGGTPEAVVERSSRHGLHRAQLHVNGAAQARTPSRFVLPPGTLDRP